MVKRGALGHRASSDPSSTAQAEPYPPALRASPPRRGKAGGPAASSHPSLTRPPSTRISRSQAASVVARWATVTRVRSAAQSLQGGEHRRLGGLVERARRLVEDEQARPAVEGAGEADALALAAGEPDAALADMGLEALGQAGEEGVELGGAHRRVEPLRVHPLGLAREGDVGGDRVVGEVDGLGDVGEAGLPGGPAGGVERPAVDQDRAFVGLEQAHQQVEQGRLAAAGRSGDPDMLARRGSGS